MRAFQRNIMLILSLPLFASNKVVKAAVIPSFEVKNSEQRLNEHTTGLGVHSNLVKHMSLERRMALGKPFSARGGSSGLAGSVVQDAQDAASPAQLTNDAASLGTNAVAALVRGKQALTADVTAGLQSSAQALTQYLSTFIAFVKDRAGQTSNTTVPLEQYINGSLTLVNSTVDIVDQIRKFLSLGLLQNDVVSPTLDGVQGDLSGALGLLGVTSNEESISSSGSGSGSGTTDSSMLTSLIGKLFK